MKRTEKNKTIALLGTMAFIFISVTVAMPFCAPFLSRVAMFSAAMAMPEGSLYALAEELRQNNAAQKPAATPAPTPAPSVPTPTQSPSEVAAEEDDETEGYFEPEATPSPTPMPVPVEIPAKYQGRIVAEDLSAVNATNIYQNKKAYIKNYTTYTSADLDKILSTPMKIELKETSQPQVLIYHTHATESYSPLDGTIYDTRNNWRTRDNTNNMVAVGAIMAETLRKNGIEVLHDTSQHDYPSYNGSYQNSYDAITAALEKYPSIQVVLDLHRDAIERNGSVISKPVVEHNGEKLAQIMIISNCDDGSKLIPEWRENLRFAAAFNDAIEQQCEGLTRPILFSHRKYNQQLSTGALLLEFGSIGNTIDESKRSAAVVGEALAALLNSTRK